MFYTYVIWSEKIKSRYTGSTRDIAKRLEEHNQLKNRYTKRGYQWKVVLVEECETVTLARKRESFLKSGAGRKWLDLNYPEYTRKGARAV